MGALGPTLYRTEPLTGRMGTIGPTVYRKEPLTNSTGVVGPSMREGTPTKSRVAMIPTKYLKKLLAIGQKYWWIRTHNVQEGLASMEMKPLHTSTVFSLSNISRSCTLSMLAPCPPATPVYNANVDTLIIFSPSCQYNASLSVGMKHVDM